MYAVMNIVAPLILILAIIFFTVRLWKRRPAEEALAERSARELREQLNEEDLRRGND